MILIHGHDNGSQRGVSKLEGATQNREILGANLGANSHIGAGKGALKNPI
jgi:hypothetical protein